MLESIGKISVSEKCVIVFFKYKLYKCLRFAVLKDQTNVSSSNNVIDFFNCWCHKVYYLYQRL